MATFDDLWSIHPSLFRSTSSDAWISEALVRDTETLSKALQKSIADGSEISAPMDSASAIVTIPKPKASLSVGFGSDSETVPKPSTPSLAPSPRRKVTKRKSCASNRSRTMFITADPANFRQMVQQLTGVRYVNGQLPAAPVLKPEPQRPAGGFVSRLEGSLPTLDTSAFLLDHLQQQVIRGPVVAVGADAAMSFAPAVPAAYGGESGPDFGSFGCFPTLESWKV
ncbi:hypothetical protein Nepgr_030145 [Nepenthes gracilis]|uniref:VQ domain-containing protein n=1 Tax=Nepenthes gracilis TaxID=150966 RepID=A0AAD3Y3N1_NEPGR|nr:hypothetical protein Nepgr_030145 [Nepenthes gracilis]